jgi:hypothetical protein
MRAFSRPTCSLPGGGAFGALAGLAQIVATLVCAPASAEPADTRGRCAAHGPDYVEVAGGERCVRIGEHVRAEMAHAKESAPPPMIGASGGLARAIAEGVKGVSETVEAPAGSDSRLYRR